MKLQTFFFTTGFPIMGRGGGGGMGGCPPPSYNSFRKTSTKTNALTVKPLHWFWVNNKFFMKRSKVAKSCHQSTSQQHFVIIYFKITHSQLKRAGFFIIFREAYSHRTLKRYKLVCATDKELSFKIKRNEY